MIKILPPTHKQTNKQTNKHIQIFSSFTENHTIYWREIIFIVISHYFKIGAPYSSWTFTQTLLLQDGFFSKTNRKTFRINVIFPLTLQSFSIFSDVKITYKLSSLSTLYIMPVSERYFELSTRRIYFQNQINPLLVLLRTAFLWRNLYTCLRENKI